MTLPVLYRKELRPLLTLGASAMDALSRMRSRGLR
jgi:hypothetical protein